MNLNINKWKPFKVQDIFDIFNGKGITKEEIESNPGSFFAIQSGAEKNGCIGKIDKDYCIQMGYTYTDEQCLTVARTGSAGHITYQPYGCVVGDSAKLLILKNKEFRKKNVYLFLRTILMALKYKYDFGRKVTEEKYILETILLPSADNKTPNYSFMDDYIRALKSQNIKTKLNDSSLSLDCKEWEPFYFGNLIEDKNIYKAKAYSKTELETKDTIESGYIHFVSRTEENNSIDCYVMKSDFSDIEEGNAITVGDTTSTIAYQSEPFVNGDHIIVIRADWLNKYTGMFIVSLLRKERYRYSYGRAYLMDSIKNTKLLLPVKKENDEPIIDEQHTFSDEGYLPDWEWMANYIKSLPFSDRI